MWGRIAVTGVLAAGVVMGAGGTAMAKPSTYPEVSGDTALFTSMLRHRVQQTDEVQFEADGVLLFYNALSGQFENDGGDYWVQNGYNITLHVYPNVCMGAWQNSTAQFHLRCGTVDHRFETATVTGITPTAT